MVPTWGMVTTQMWFPWTRPGSSTSPRPGRLRPHRSKTWNNAAQLGSAGEHLQPPNRWGLGPKRWGHSHQSDTSGSLLEKWMPQSLHNLCALAPGKNPRSHQCIWGSLPPRAMSSRVRRTRSPEPGMKDPGRTQLYASVEAEFCMLVLSCHLVHKEVAIESLLLFLTLKM